MLTHLHVRNFKSWADTGLIRFSPLTGFFGVNSSGKTAILQQLLLFKQTVESSDRSRPLHLGDDRTYVDLGTFYDVIHSHQIPGKLKLQLGWQLSKPLRIRDPEKGPGSTLFSIDTMNFCTSIVGNDSRLWVESFDYSSNPDKHLFRFGMRQRAGANGNGPSSNYELIGEGYEFKRTQGRAWPLPAPVRFYSFPDQVNAYYQNTGFLGELALALEELFHSIYYLGPLREHPHRTYVWAGEQPLDVGQRGELAIPALLAAEQRKVKISRGKGRKRQTVTERVAQWLRDLGLIHSFSVQPIAQNRKEYEVRVRRSPDAAEVALTDVGFGVSQILPVLTLCYYAPEHSTLILEQPEIHLHPKVQAGLADVFIDAIQHRNLQIVLESHSEHLLRRLQRRIAEEKIAPEQTALYFIDNLKGRSEIQHLELDLFGNITNWPQNFFGDELGDLAAMTEAAIRRQMEMG